MKVLLIILVLFCLQDLPKSDTTKVNSLKRQKLFFEQKTIEQRAEDINVKLDSLLLRLEARNDTTKIK